LVIEISLKETYVLETLMRFSIPQSGGTSIKQPRISKDCICIETVTVTTFNFKRFSHCCFFFRYVY